MPDPTTDPTVDPEDLVHELRMHDSLHCQAPRSLLRQAADEIERLQAKAPPTASEVLAHLEAGGVVEEWDWVPPVPTLLRNALRDVDPSTPQPGLRLTQGAEGPDPDYWASEVAVMAYQQTCTCGYVVLREDREAADKSMGLHRQFAHPAWRNPAIACQATEIHGGWCLRPRGHDGRHWTPSHSPDGRSWPAQGASDA